MQIPPESPEAILSERLFLSVPETATLLGCDERTIRRGCDNGEIPCTKIGVKWIIPTRWVRDKALIG